MREVVLYIASSIDGCIARKDGGVDWLDVPEYRLKGEDYGYGRLMSAVDTTLMGYRTYRQIRDCSPFPYEGLTNIVFTRSARRKQKADVLFVKRNIAEFVRSLKRRNGKGIWLVGGSQINSVLLNAGLIDRIILTILPVAIGPGIPLFAAGAGPRRFRLRHHRRYPNGFAQITWQKR